MTLILAKVTNSILAIILATGIKVLQWHSRKPQGLLLSMYLMHIDVKRQHHVRGGVGWGGGKSIVTDMSII